MRIDAVARQGFRLTNCAPDAQCAPSRSALMTRRDSIRSGTHSVPAWGAGSWGLVVGEDARKRVGQGGLLVCGVREMACRRGTRALAAR